MARGQSGSTRRPCRGSGGRPDSNPTRWIPGNCSPTTDPLFIDKVRDVVGLYLDPPDKAMVLAADEKFQMQVLDRISPDTANDARHTRTPYPRLRPARHGTTSLFAALGIAAGKVIGQHQRASGASVLSLRRMAK